IPSRGTFCLKQDHRKPWDLFQQKFLRITVALLYLQRDLGDFWKSPRPYISLLLDPQILLNNIKNRFVVSNRIRHAVPKNPYLPKWGHPEGHLQAFPIPYDHWIWPLGYGSDLRLFPCWWHRHSNNRR